MLHGQVGLAAAGATTHLDARNQLGHCQERRLLLSQPLGVGLVGLGLGTHLPLGKEATGQDLLQQPHRVVAGRPRIVAGVQLEVVEDLVNHPGQVTSPTHLPAGGLGGGKIR